jgi:hypothetical protein
MFCPDPEPSTLEYQLLVARRRMEALAPGSPSWDAAIEGVEELESALARGRGTSGAAVTPSGEPTEAPRRFLVRENVDGRPPVMALAPGRNADQG